MFLAMDGYAHITAVATRASVGDARPGNSDSAMVILGGVDRQPPPVASNAGRCTTVSPGSGPAVQSCAPDGKNNVPRSKWLKIRASRMFLADGEGFEPPVSVNPRRFSRPVP